MALSNIESREEVERVETDGESSCIEYQVLVAKHNNAFSILDSCPSPGRHKQTANLLGPRRTILMTEISLIIFILQHERTPEKYGAGLLRLF